MTKKEYFDNEKDFLKLIYDKHGILLSKNRIEGELKISPELLLEKNFTLEYCNIVTYENGFSYIDAIFKNKSDIFIYLSKRDIIETGYQTMVYFEPTKLEETKFFIKNLIRMK
jgi:hypothetical protein